MRRSDGESGKKGIRFALDYACEECGDEGVTMPACTDDDDSIYVCRACINKAFRLVEGPDGPRGEN